MPGFVPFDRAHLKGAHYSQGCPGLCRSDRACEGGTEQPGRSDTPTQTWNAIHTLIAKRRDGLASTLPTLPNATMDLSRVFRGIGVAVADLLPPPVVHPRLDNHETRQEKEACGNDCMPY